MQLRATLERFVPIEDDETGLSKPAREFIFRGFYAGRKVKIIGFNSESRYGLDCFTHRIHRRHSHLLNSERSVYSEKVRPVVLYPHEKSAQNELLRPAALKRANHIEHVAREVKLVGATLLAIAGVAAYTAAEHGSTAPAAHHTVPLETTQYYGLSPYVQVQGGVEAPAGMATPSASLPHSGAPGSIDNAGGTVAP
jgi:hypothetical protein